MCRCHYSFLSACCLRLVSRGKRPPPEPPAPTPSVHLHRHPSAFLPSHVADIPVSWPPLSELIHRAQSNSISPGNIKDANLRLSPRGTDCFFTIALLTAILMNGCVGKCRTDRLLGFNLLPVSPNPNELHLSAVSRRILSRRSIQTCQASLASMCLCWRAVQI